MTKEQIVKSINDYVDAVILEHKEKMMCKYVRSKKVQFETSFVKFGERETIIKSKSKSRYEQIIWDRHYPSRKRQEIYCSCPDFGYRTKKDKKPCKHIFALIDRYQSKRSELTKQL